MTILGESKWSFATGAVHVCEKQSNAAFDERLATLNETAESCYVFFLFLDCYMIILNVHRVIFIHIT